MSDSGDDGGTEWYEEPITIVGFVAGFLLLVLVIASVLILCFSKEEDDKEDSEEHSSTTARDNHGLQGTLDEHDKTNPLYIAANEFDLRPFPTPLRAKFVHIHVDEPRVTREGFESYYNIGRHSTQA